MSKNFLKETLELFETSVNDNKAEVNIMFVDQNNYREKKYKGMMLKTTPDCINPVVMEIVGNAKEEIMKRSLDDYDLLVSPDDSTQTVDKANVIYGSEIIEQISADYTNDNVVSENTDLSKIKFMVIHIYTNGKSIYFFKKYVQPTTAYKTTKKYTISGSVLKPFKENIITISSTVDAFLLNDKYYIFNRNSFNSMFAYKDVYKRILTENSESIKSCGFINNTDKFISDCESDGRYLVRLTKVILAKGFEEIKTRKNEMPKVIKDFNLSLNLSETGEIIYGGKEEVPEILNLMLRHYVIDALTSNKMIAAAIQEYKAV